METRASAMTGGIVLALAAGVLLWFSLVLLATEQGLLASVLAATGVSVGALAWLKARRQRRRAMRRRRRGASDWTPPRSRRAGSPLNLFRDPVTGRVRGHVLGGVDAGRPLDSVPLAELLAIAATIDPTDGRLVALLEAYLDERHPGWDAGIRADRPGMEGGGHHAGLDAGRMTPEEAYRVLGLAPGASLEAVAEAHARLIRRVHPDAGGSDALAAQVNAARAQLSQAQLSQARSFPSS